MTKPIRRSRTETFEHTIAGLLTKRSSLATEASQLRDRLADIRSDMEALDRVLRCLGHEGDLDASMPPKRREAIFGRGELSRGILDVLRDAKAPMTTREIARLVLNGMDQETASKALMPSQVRSVSKALNHLSASGVVRAGNDERCGRVWSLTAL